MHNIFCYFIVIMIRIFGLITILLESYIFDRAIRTCRLKQCAYVGYTRINVSRATCAEILAFSCKTRDS